MKDEIFVKYESEKKYQNSLKALDEGFEDTFAYLANDVIHSRVKSTNCLERLNQENKIEKINIYVWRKENHKRSLLG